MSTGGCSATHDMLVSWNMASLGRLDEAEAAALSSIERFDVAGEVLLVVNALNALAGVAAAKGELEGASAAYEALLERCRASGQHPYLPFCLVSLAGLRARQGDAAAADRLYQEAIGCCYNPWLSADAMVGQAAVARHLGDLARARGLLDTAADRYRDADLPDGQARVLAGLAWWAIGAGQPATAVSFAADAVKAAKAIGDPESQLLADSALAAATAIADPTQRNTDRFVALAQQRARVSRIAPSPTSRIWWHSPLGSHQPRPEPATPQLDFSPGRPSQAVATAPQHHLRAASGHTRNLRVMHRDPERPGTRPAQSASVLVPRSRTTVGRSRQTSRPPPSIAKRSRRRTRRTP